MARKSSDLKRRLRAIELERIDARENSTLRDTEGLAAMSELIQVFHQVSEAQISHTKEIIENLEREKSRNPVTVNTLQAKRHFPGSIPQRNEADPQSAPVSLSPLKIPPSFEVSHKNFFFKILILLYEFFMWGIYSMTLRCSFKKNSSWQRRAQLGFLNNYLNNRKPDVNSIKQTWNLMRALLK